MIHLNITGKNYQLDDKIKKYVNRKIGQLDRILPKNSRNGLKAEVVLAENSSQPNERYRCEVRIHLPQENAYVSEATVVSMHTAVDLAEGKLRNQFNKYKSKKMGARQQARRIVRRLKRFGRR